MPAISDPAYRIVRAAIEEGIPVIPIPGATALAVALVASGFQPTPSFLPDFCRLGATPGGQGSRSCAKFAQRSFSMRHLIGLPTRLWTRRRCWVIAGLHWLAS
jgi:16S rRNA (cytidine1402-2'-O)-methyltransferase